MSKCIKGQSEDKPKEGTYRCHKCGAISKKKDHLCKPEKLTGKVGPKDDKKQKDKDK